MPPTGPHRRERLTTTGAAEPRSWWPFVAGALGAAGSYVLLVVHLLLDATNASVWGLGWMAVPVAFFAASAGALFIASGMRARERLAAISGALLGYSPRERSRRRSTSPSHEAM